VDPDPFELPIRSAIPALLTALDERGTAVLAAPPGTGKTTLMPLALAGLLPGVRVPRPRRVLVCEPRRLAARAAARRMAWLLGEPVGRRIGFTVRGERRPGSHVEVVTTGVLLQRLQRDPDPRTDVVILDECHERHLDADTALAFLLDIRSMLLPDLTLVAASATADTSPWARLLDTDRVIHSGAASHPVRIVWAPPARPVAPPHGMRVDPALLDHVAGTVRRALAEGEGDVLCFLPGAGEIARVAGMLTGEGGRGGGWGVLQVHGRAPAEVQDEVLRPAGERRVVLATSVAESSLTVPGVRIVVDAGLAREPRTDHSRGLGTLVTVAVSRASADQRAGRAGRQGAGTVYRCWTEAEHERLHARSRPEIALADLTAFALQAACWGDPDASGLALLDPPPAGAMAAARQTLRSIDAVDPDGRVTERGRRFARIGVHPRLARALLDGAAEVGQGPAAEIVALLSDPPTRRPNDDLAAEWRQTRRASPPAWRDEVRRLRSALSDLQPSKGAPPPRLKRHPTGGRPEEVRPDGAGPVRQGPPTGGNGDEVLLDRTGPARQGTPAHDPVGLVVALAFPERIAKARGGGYLMASGTAAELPKGAHPGSPWLAISVADRPAGAPSARIRQAVAIDEDVARYAAASLITVDDEIGWHGDVTARRVERLGAIELSTAPLRHPDPVAIRAAVLDGLRRTGLSLLTWTREATALRERLAFCHRVLGDPWPAVDDAALLAVAPRWIGDARRRADLERLDVRAALTRLLPWECAARLDDVAPERITVPSGSKIRIDYSADQPVLAVKLQEAFGWQTTPTLADGRAPLVVHLLSPAGRPAAVTADLASFWRDGYRGVRAELRGRYPRHPWPEDPATATPTRRTNPRR
jgi:ATP-dependent helicase HrpB